jgi:diaminopimelate decarboxylase
MPISQEFEDRLSPVLEKIADHFGTPFHIYDERGIRETGRLVIEAFSGVENFKEYYAVKALPNPRILEIMKSMGFGFDCSSIPELVLSRRAGALGEDLMFTSNNTTQEEFQAALSDGGCILNLDDITLIPKVPAMPELICFRYNPGPERTGNDIIGKPEEAKYGVSSEQVVDAFRMAQELGAKRFGLHTMLVSNELNHSYMVETALMLSQLAEKVSERLGIRFEFFNIGGGFGIPYRPEEKALDIIAMGKEIAGCIGNFKERNGYAPAFHIESGRFMTGPHGVLVTRAINKKDTYRKYVGVDACSSSLMRPGIYGAYHEITVHGKKNVTGSVPVDVVGALCENNDKFAIQRKLPEIEEGDLIVIHDTGAHGHSMGFNYNGRLRPKELLLRSDGSIELIRREETIEDHFATLDFKENIIKGAM